MPSTKVLATNKNKKKKQLLHKGGSNGTRKLIIEMLKKYPRSIVI